MLHPNCVRIDADDAVMRKSLLNTGWREIEVLAIMECETAKSAWVDQDHIRQMRLEESPKVLELMSENLGPNRLTSDPKMRPRVGAKMACQVRELYIKNNPLNVYVHDKYGLQSFLVQEGNYLKFMAVEEGGRNRSIGSEMTDAFIYRSWLWGHDVARLGTQETNTLALRLYKSRGFEIVRRLRTFHK